MSTVAGKSSGKARYVTQCWRWRPGSSSWFETSSKDLFSALDGRRFNVSDYVENSALGVVSCKLRPLRAEEVRRNGRGFASTSHICIEFTLESEDKDGALNSIAKNNPGFSDDKVSDLYNWHIGLALENFCENILFLSSFAYGCILSTEASRTTVGREVLSHGATSLSAMDHDESCYDFLSGVLTPPSDLDAVLIWSRCCGGIWDGAAMTNVEKAMMFLSHAMERKTGVDSIANIVWLTAGLEALACDNSNSIAVQLQRRLPLICRGAPFNDIRKFIREAYDFRSRLFHGDIAIHSRFNENDVDWSDRRYDARMEHFGLGLRVLLLSALWNCVSANGAKIDYIEEPLIT